MSENTEKCEKEIRRGFAGIIKELRSFEEKLIADVHGVKEKKLEFHNKHMALLRDLQKALSRVRCVVLRGKGEVGRGHATKNNLFSFSLFFSFETHTTHP